MNIIEYYRFPEKKRFLHYMALGRVWYGAKYSHGVWERFAHIFGNLIFGAKIEKCKLLFLSEPMSADLGISVYL